MAIADPTLTRLIALDARLAQAVSDIRLLNAVSWPAHLQEIFLAHWHAGQPQLPEVSYPEIDFGDIHLELRAIQAEADPQHPLGEYLRRSAESWHTAASLLENMGSPAVTGYSTQLFGRPGDLLPGSRLSNLDAARHFIRIANELDGEAVRVDAEPCLSAETVRDELQAALNAFFVNDHISVELDPELIAKAAAGHSRIRLRSSTLFTEYDHRQLLEHEAYVHSLTALNGRDQPYLKSLGRTAPRVTATQEGLATFAELITGAIDIERLKRISLRIVAIDHVLNGADFIDVFRFFRAAGQSEPDSFNSAQRVFRACPPSGGSAFTKDMVYLHGLLSVHTFFRWVLKQRRLKLAHLLFAGKMALHDVFTLEPLFDDGTIAAPRYLPPWLLHARGVAGTLAFSLFANQIRLDQVAAEDLVLGL